MKSKETNKMEIKTECCSQRMRERTQDINGELITSPICLSCGRHVYIHEEEMDAEDLEEYRQQYKYKGKRNETIYIIRGEDRKKAKAKHENFYKRHKAENKSH